MHSFKQKLAAFMRGRYGTDSLYYGMFVLYLILLLLHGAWPSAVWSVLMSVVLVLIVFRSMSRNIYARRRENEYFLKFWRPVKAEMKLCRDRLRDRKTARYRRCSHCHVVIRLPNRKGSHTVLCPHCKERFSVNIRF